MKWDRQDAETPKAYEAFKIYLEVRSVPKVAEKLRKSETLIHRWKSKYDWQERVRAYDESVMEAARRELKRKIQRDLHRQYERNGLIIDKAMAALESKDFTKASFKSLNEMYHMAFMEQMQIADKVGAAADNNLTIRILKGRNEDRQGGE